MLRTKYSTIIFNKFEIPKILNKKRVLYSIFASIIFILAILLRLEYINQPLDVDEIHTLVVSKSSVFDIVFGKDYDPGNPPLFTILSKLSSKSLNSILVTRFLSLSLFSLFFWSIYYEMRDYSIYTSTSQLLFISFSFIFIELAVYGRSYQLVILAAFAFSFALANYISSSTHRHFIFSLFWAIIGVYSHYLFIVYIGITFVATFLLLVFEKKKSEIKKLLYLYLAIGAISLPLVVTVLFNQFGPVSSWRKYALWQNSIPNITHADWISLLSNYSISIELKFLATFLLLLLTAFLIFLFHKLKDLFSLKEKIILTIGFSSLLLIFFTPYVSFFRLAKYHALFLPIISLSILILLKNKKIIGFLIMISLLFWGLKPLVTSQVMVERTDKWQRVSSYLDNYSSSSSFVFEPCWLSKVVTYNTTISKDQIYCHPNTTSYRDIPSIDSMQDKSKKLLYISLDKPTANYSITSGNQVKFEDITVTHDYE